MTKKSIKDFMGKWRITDMEGWDADYYDMEVPAYIEVSKDRGGHFQFGLVQGEMDGKIVEYPEYCRFEFT